MKSENKKEERERILSIVKEIFIWVGLIAYASLMVEAVFFTELKVWAWGLTNKKLEITIIIGAAVMAMIAFFTSSNNKKRIEKLEAEK